MATHHIIQEWLKLMGDHEQENNTDTPSYYLTDPRNELVCSSRPLSFRIGTGEQILRDILPFVAAAKSEVLIVTCFLAESLSRAALISALEDLSSQAGRDNRRVRVSLSFSTTGLHHTLQSIFARSASSYHSYASPCWEQLFGFRPSKLTNLDMRISSVFEPPLSVMHPKFIIIDGKRAFLPSCNVSWENWFEGCIEVSGDVVTSLLRFWQHFWGRDGVPVGNVAAPTASSSCGVDEQPLLEPTTTSQAQHATLLSGTSLDLGTVPTVLLPSPHHANPKFRPPFLSAAVPPPTPLNIFLLTSFRKAQKTIFIQTPNLTSPPVLSSLYEALKRGVDVRINTSSRIMLLEQIATAGTITELSILGLKRRCVKLLKEYQNKSQGYAEGGQRQPGVLSISFYKAKEGESGAADEPVKSHLKLTIVDEEIVVLGSGNMDRASWYTSQEVGIAFFSHNLARKIRSDVDASLQGRLCGSSWPA